LICINIIFVFVVYFVNVVAFCDFNNRIQNLNIILSAYFVWHQGRLNSIIVVLGFLSAVNDLIHLCHADVLGQMQYAHTKAT